jgi:hypothetical protein
VFAVDAESEPTSAVNVTGTPGTPAPLTSSTRAEISELPPDGPERLRTCAQHYAFRSRRPDTKIL